MPQAMSSNSGLSSPLYLEVPNCSPPTAHYPLDPFAMNNPNMMDINSFYENLSNLNAFHTLAESFNYFYDRQQSRPEPKYSPAKSFSIESILGSPASMTSSSAGGDEMMGTTTIAPNNNNNNTTNNNLNLVANPMETQFNLSPLLKDSPLSSFPNHHDYRDYGHNHHHQTDNIRADRLGKAYEQRLGKKKTLGKVSKEVRVADRVANKSKRIRTIFTSEQLERLEEEFNRQQYMVGTGRLYLASTLNLTEAQVKVWFQNRRIKWRKKHLEEKPNVKANSA